MRKNYLKDIKDLGIEDLVVTEEAVNFILKVGKPVSATDFTGYIVPIDDKNMISAAVDLFGKTLVFSSDPKLRGKKKKTLNRIKKTYKTLIQKRFLEVDDTPFPDCSLAHNIPIDVKKTLFVEEPLFLPNLLDAV